MLGLAILCGCNSLTEKRHGQEAIEAELRQQERHIIELKQELDRKEGLLHAQDAELDRLQIMAAANQKQNDSSFPEATLKDINLGRLSGGYRSNIKQPFDDSILISLTPRDVDQHAIKVPGTVRVELFEVSPQGLKTPLCHWEITHRELRKHWEQPLIGGASYRLILPFKTTPASEKIKLIVRFTTLDGRMFEAEKEATVKLPYVLPRPGSPTGILPQNSGLSGTAVPNLPAATSEKATESKSKPTTGEVKPPVTNKEAAQPETKPEKLSAPKLEPMVPPNLQLSPSESVPQLPIPGGSKEVNPKNSLNQPPPKEWVTTMKSIQPAVYHVPAIQLLKPVTLNQP